MFFIVQFFNVAEDIPINRPKGFCLCNIKKTESR